ncbi:MAG: hypothetical protein O3A00_13415 [Planctomycetota bacterium]|nr:hypothetical protein [Planctomycetota bacterium]
MRRPTAAIEPLKAAVVLFAELEGDRRTGTLARPDAEANAEDGQECPSYISTANRTATLGDLSNAFKHLGRGMTKVADPQRRRVRLRLTVQRHDRAATRTRATGYDLAKRLSMNETHSIAFREGSE